MSVALFFSTYSVNMSVGSPQFHVLMQAVKNQQFLNTV